MIDAWLLDRCLLPFLQLYSNFLYFILKLFNIISVIFVIVVVIIILILRRIALQIKMYNVRIPKFAISLLFFLNHALLSGLILHKSTIIDKFSLLAWLLFKVIEFFFYGFKVRKVLFEHFDFIALQGVQVL